MHDIWTILAAARRTPPLPNPAASVAIVTRRLTEAQLRALVKFKDHPA